MIYQSCGNRGSMECVSLFGLHRCRWCRWGLGVGLGRGLGGWAVLCLCVLWILIFCVDGRSRYLYIMLGGYLRMVGSPSVQSCFTLSISASYRVFVYGRYRKSRLVFVLVSNLDWSPKRPSL